MKKKKKKKKKKEKKMKKQVIKRPLKLNYLSGDGARIKSNEEFGKRIKHESSMNQASMMCVLLMIKHQ